MVTETTRLPSASKKANVRLKPPSKRLLASESRWVIELALSLAAMPILLNAKRGDAHPVLVLPGFLTSDRSTTVLRRYLKALGYDVHGWELGRNLGGMRSMQSKLSARLAAVYAKTGRKVSIVGWSLGGVYARDLALSNPAAVRSVITLGSPFAGDISATNATRLYALLSGETISSIDAADLTRLGGDLPVPVTSLYSKSDGIVNWQTSRLVENERAENIEVRASHLGLGVNPAVLWAVADRLALPENTFKRFARRGPFALAYAR